uniref:glycosyl hydrolase n=1 Tax=Mediterraneibacter glycyrrhizinilyticus TaxID=342942 RepID=UPI000AA0A165
MAENHIFPFLWMRGEAEEILREEIGKIAECGIKAVCVEARPHDDFCGDGWWHDMDIVIDEAKKRDMKIWILDDKHFPTGYANGLIEKKYPERKKLYINCTTADVFGSSHKLTLNISRMLKPTIGYWEIGKPVNEEERKNNRMLAIAAVRFYEGDVFTEDVIDLTDTFDGTFATFELPEGQWRVYVIYKTRTDGGNESYINMIDKESAHTQIEGVYEAHYAHYADEFGKTIAGFFSDEPQFGNTSEMGFDMNVGRRKMPLPWSDELQEMMEEKYGNAFLSYLPYLFAETKEKQMGVQIRYDYMDMVSKLYQKNFSDMIGAWCREHGVEYIGHVVEDNGIHSRLGMGAAHYFRAMSGQDMAGIDCIGGQIVYGAPVETRRGMVDADGEFYHYALGKMGASCGHLDPKKKGRTMCELFGAYGWSFGVRDMKYLLDHLLAKGVNYLVPHAFSMADYPDIDCPPHFYARGNNPEFPYFAELMKYGNRMCDLLSGGRHIASVAVLYDGEADWSGEHMPMQKVCRELLGSQIDLDIVSLDMLCDLSAYNGACDGNTLQINGETFGGLVIPYVKQIPARLADVLTQMDGLPVFFVDAMPDQVIGQEEKAVRLPKSCVQVPLANLSETLKAHGMYEVEAVPAYKHLSVYHYEKDRQIFMLLNESAEQRFAGNVYLPIGEDVVYYDAMKDCYENAKVKPAEDGKGVWLK